MKYLTRSIWILSVVSLLNDISSEMLYPIMPLFLQSIGFSTVLIGVLEGFAEATAGLSKGYFGRLSDATAKRLPFVQLGYWLSAFSKPMMAVFGNVFWIFSARALDRLGKGVRTGARDALLSNETTAETKGRVFGFHRSMDTFGAVIGPLAALGFLYYYPGQYKLLFVLAFIPAAIASSLTFFLKEPKGIIPAKSISLRLSQTFSYLKNSPRPYRQLAGILLFFGLFNSTDLFLLMKIKQTGWSDNYVIGCYILYNLVYAVVAFPLGKLADTIGLKRMLMVGLVMFSAVYAGFGCNEGAIGFVLLFALYGIYAAATEGISKALISNIVPQDEAASALGTFTGLNSVVLLMASSLAGIIWKYVSPEALFITSATGSLLTVIMLWRYKH